MKPIIEICSPREDIKDGTFNPEIFTASLTDVINYYSGENAAVHAIYSDAFQFFNDATFPTDGMKLLLSEVFSRLSGNNSVPAIHRLETAFGGGKTHTLIACAHIAKKGLEVKNVVREIIPENLLPKPDDIIVVGIAGDKLPVHKPKGIKLTPHTLWGEIAYQVGGEALYREVDTEAESYADPGEPFLQKIFTGKRILIMLDELAQYAARLSVAVPNGEEQLAAFLMTLNGYARSTPGISVIVTLASASDAFSRQTGFLAKLLSDTAGREIEQNEAMGIGEQAISSIGSVVARDATAIVPVQASEISSVLAKRLFSRINTDDARAVVDAYAHMYEKNMSQLPEAANRSGFKERMLSYYPFHPSLIDFLNNKLATYENFQGTRGVLRVLALAIRNLWQKHSAIPMIHTCHLDLRDARLANELIGRTGTGELLPIVNADIGGADTKNAIEGGESNAARADRENPHPEGAPVYEYTWKTVFLHSLVGREIGLGSNLFGLTEMDALFEVSNPMISPSQVRQALEEIAKRAFYLRYDQGRYFASLEPTIINVLSQIRRSLRREDVDALLDQTARKEISGKTDFKVITDVELPEHIPDKQGKPTLGLVKINAGEINVEEFVSFCGPSQPRIEQNLVFLLVPETVKIHSGVPEQQHIDIGESPQHPLINRLRNIAKDVMAIQSLKKNPQYYGVRQQTLNRPENLQFFSERENALGNSVSQCYTSLWYPSASGQVIKKDISPGGGESARAIWTQIREVLLNDGELVTEEHTSKTALTHLRKMFFSSGDNVSLEILRQNFCRLRKWPILERPAVFETIIRAGVDKGYWSLFIMGDADSSKPAEIYSREQGMLPLTLDFQKDYYIITVDGAKQRGWLEPTGSERSVNPKEVEDHVIDIVKNRKVTPQSKVIEAISEMLGDLPEDDVRSVATDVIPKVVQNKRAIAYEGTEDQTETPKKLWFGADAVTYLANPDDILMTIAEGTRRGWITERKEPFELKGREGAEILIPMLRRMGSIYERGGKSTIDYMGIYGLKLPSGGTVRLDLEKITPESVKDLGELLGVMSGIIESDEDTQADLEIVDPKDDCPFVQALKKAKQQ